MSSCAKYIIKRPVTNDGEYVRLSLVLSSFMTYHRVCNKSSTCGATVDPTGTATFTPCFSGVHVT